MDRSTAANLRVWNGEGDGKFSASSGPAHARVIATPYYTAADAESLYLREALHPSRKARRKDGAAEPLTLQWFLNAEAHRHRGQAVWVPRLLEFEKHGGETLLGLGDSLGSDWAQYALHGASVIVCSSSAEQLSLAQRNFHLRGLTGRFCHVPEHSVPAESGSIDVVCINGLANGRANPPEIVDEVYRVLKPGGKVLVLAPAHFDVDFWYQLCFPWRRPSRNAKSFFGDVDHRFSSRSLKQLFGRFVEHRVRKRHLTRDDIPHLWRCLPRVLLERWMGRILVLKAFKPLSAAMPTQAAA